MNESKEKNRIAKRNRKRGKNTERAIATILGVKPMGILGDMDIIWNGFSIEVKDRARVRWRKYMDQSVRNCPPDKIPLLWVHEHNTNHKNDLVCMLARDWLGINKNPHRSGGQ